MGMYQNEVGFLFGCFQNDRLQGRKRAPYYETSPYVDKLEKWYEFGRYKFCVMWVGVVVYVIIHEL